MHSNLRSFLTQLRQEKEVVEIDTEVDPYLELAEIHRRVIAENGPVLFFNKVKGSPFPVVTNLFGTRRRVELAVGPKPEQIVRQAVKALPELLPPKLPSLWQQKEWLMPLTKLGMRDIKSSQAPILEVRENTVNLQQLPALTSWPEDGGPFVTLPLVYTEHPVTHEHNLGMYRIQIHSAQQTGMHWQIQKGGGFHYHCAEQLNQDFPVTLFLGGPPALTLAAIAPLPEMLPELIFTSFLLGEKLPKVQVSGHPHSLIAEAEFAFCGFVPPHLRKPEGPFGDHYGYYSLQHDFPVFNVHSVYRRRDAIYPATVVGKPRQEDYYIGEYLSSLLSPMFPVVMPGIKALWSYAETGFHSLVGAIVRESYHREALSHAFRILGEGQLTLTKFLLISDQEVDLHNFPALLENILASFRPEEDLHILHETSMDTLDYTGRRLNHGSKAILLGLGKPWRALPREYTGELIDGVCRALPYCAGCLVISGQNYEQAPELPEQLLHQIQEKLADWPLIILVDEPEKCRTQEGFLWQVFTRFDPAHDIYAQYEVNHHRMVYHGPILIDARMKTGYPKEVEPDAQTVSLVDRRWSAYGIKL